MKVMPLLYGGIGNNLFQICAALSYSMKHKINCCIPNGIQNPHYNGQKVFYSQYLNYCEQEMCTAMLYKEPRFEHDEIPPPEHSNVLLDGYFQSWKYFNDYREEILEILDIPYEFKESKIFLHYRLGDYKRLRDCHLIIKNDYIEKAIAYFVQHGLTEFIVFSDEIDEAEKIINCGRYPNAKFEYSEGRTEIEDLSLMSSCEGGIMSASSFSWWGAWLGQNENRKIVYPADWFGEQLINHNTKDLCPENWIKI